MTAEERQALVSKYPVLRFFEFGPLSADLQDVAFRFEDLAFGMAAKLDKTRHPDEVAAGLRHLLEALDCFVRATLP